MTLRIDILQARKASISNAADVLQKEYLRLQGNDGERSRIVMTRKGLITQLRRLDNEIAALQQEKTKVAA
jgi:hypothetical protein